MQEEEYSGQLIKKKCFRRGCEETRLKSIPGAEKDEFPGAKNSTTKNLKFGKTMLFRCKLFRSRKQLHTRVFRGDRH